MSTVDESKRDAWNAMQEARGRRDDDEPPLKGGDGGGTSGGMDSRVTKLETHMEYVRRDLDDIRAGQTRMESSQNEILQKLNLLPTRTELNTWKFQWLAASLTIIALVITFVFAGLNFLKP